MDLPILPHQHNFRSINPHLSSLQPWSACTQEIQNYTPCPVSWEIASVDIH